MKILLLSLFSLCFAVPAVFAQQPKEGRPLDLKAMAKQKEADRQSMMKTLPDHVRQQYEARQRRQQLQTEISQLMRQLQEEPDPLKKLAVEKQLKEKLGQSFDDNVILAKEQEKQLEEGLKRVKADIKKNAEKGAKERFIKEVITGLTAPAPVAPDKKIENPVENKK